MPAMSFSAASLTFFFWSALAPSSSSAASSSSSFWRRVAMRESRRSPSVFSSRRMLFSCVGEVAVTRLLVDGDHHVGGEVDDLLEVLRRHVQQVARGATGTPLKYQMWVTGAASSMWPMRSRRTEDLVTSTPQRSQTMPLKRTRLYLPQAHSQSRRGSEDLLSEEAVLLGLERAVVDGLGLLDLAVRPTTDVVSGGQADAKLIESC